MNAIFVLAIAYNLPKLARNASWKPNATTVVNFSILGCEPKSIFLTKSNKWYTIPNGCALIKSGIEGSVNPITSASAAWSIFGAGDDNVYAYDSSNNQVNMWSMNLTNSQPVMFISDYCQGLFVDTNNTLYCSLTKMNQVVSKSLDEPTNSLTIVAGTHCDGISSKTLAYPSGIFVDFNFSLYVADSNNNRIQRFSSGQMNASTIAGNGAAGTIDLLYPADVVLDGDGYVFIADCFHDRIVGSGPDGFRCVAGCSGVRGSVSNQLCYPWSLSFDSYGNIWVADASNHRIQKFVLNTPYDGACPRFVISGIVSSSLDYIDHLSIV